MQPAWYTPFSHFVSGLVTRSLDYALPLRCPACGDIVDEEGGFCAPCWSSLPFIADPLCACCGEPLPALAEQGALCGQCLADPPRYDRVRAVAWHDGAARVIVHRLKYGRRIGHARIMARHMARLLPDGARDAMLVPVPLHRWRIWARGFNQAALIARALAQRTGVEARLDIIRRVRRTPPLHPLGRSARERALRGAFALAPGAAELICGRPVILIDDVWTTGATATGCAQLLADAGAARIDILCWARTGENPLD